MDGFCLMLLFFDVFILISFEFPRRLVKVRHTLCWGTYIPLLRMAEVSEWSRKKKILKQYFFGQVVQF